MNLLLFGAPGCGKGSVSASIQRDYGLLHISAGNILREEVEAGTELGHEVSELMKKGNLIPDEVIVNIIMKRLQKPDAKKGVLLDGFPRTLNQAKALSASDFKIDGMIFIDVDPDRLEERCVQRRVDPVTGRIYNLKSLPPPVEVQNRLLTRSDDTREKHRRRMACYREQELAIMKYYEGIIIKVNGNPPLEQVYAELRSKLDALSAGKAKSKL